MWLCHIESPLNMQPVTDSPCQHANSCRKRESDERMHNGQLVRNMPGGHNFPKRSPHAMSVRSTYTPRRTYTRDQQ